MGILSKIAEAFTGGTAKAATSVANDVADIVERWNPGEGKKHEMSQEINEYIHKTIESARQHDHPMDSGLPIADALVNGVNRLIRPWVTIVIIGSLFGYWELPPPDNIAPQYWDMALIVLSFWFGGRFLVKDIPQGIKAIVK